MTNNHENVLKKDLLTFVIDDKTYAFPILCLQGVIGNPNISQIENSPYFVVGRVTAGNVEIPVLDLRIILNRPNLIVPNKTCVVFVRVAFKKMEKLVGFVVDSLYSVYHICAEMIKKFPFNEDEEFITGLFQEQDKMILLLDLEKIINEDNIILFLNKFWNENYPGNNTNSDRRNTNGV